MQPKLLLAIGTGIALSLFVVATNAKSFWVFWAFYCLGFGILVGFTLMVPIHHSWLWFPANKGFASGLCIAGTGVGGFIFVKIMNPVINPDEASFKNVCFEGADYGCFPTSVNDNF